MTNNTNEMTPTNQELATLANDFLTAVREHNKALVERAHAIYLSILSLFAEYRTAKAEYAELYNIVDTLADALSAGADEMEGFVTYHAEVEKLFAAIEALATPQTIEDEDEDDTAPSPEAMQTVA